MIKKMSLFLIFLAAGIWIFLIGGYLGTLPTPTRTLIKVLNPLVAFGFTLACRRRAAWRAYYPVALAFTLASLGLLLVWISRDWFSWALESLSVPLSSPQGWAIDKLAETLPMVLPVLVLVPIFGKGYGDLYLQKGRLGTSLLLGIGMSALVVLVYGFGNDVFPKIPSMLPFSGWIVLFAVTNSFMEELLLRGLFLRKYEAFFSPVIALLLSTLIFTSLHGGINYLSSDNLPMMLVYTALLGFGNGAIMQHSDSIWGAVLAHTIADILLVVSVFGVVP